MHAAVRRMPAERARHAKRLGHVQSGSGPAPVLAVNADTSSTGATTATTQQTSTSATSTSSSPSTPTNQSSSSALPSSLPTQSSSLAASSATISSIFSATSSASTRVATPSSSLISSSNPLTSASPTPSVPTPQANAAAVTQSGLSGSAIAGIIAGGVIVGTALIVFFVRKTYLRRRGRKHILWTEAPGLDEPKPFPDVNEQPAPSTGVTDTPQRNTPLSPFEAYGQPMYPSPIPPVVHMRPTIPTYAIPTPPPATYNNPAAYPTQPIPSMYNSESSTALATRRVPVSTGFSSTLPAVRAQYAPMEAIVKCTFVPTLPDELSITTGERIFIIEQYDDGWDLCANGRGERGVVPRECLARAPSDQPDVGWRNVQRISSLNPEGRRL